jgi:hypothetical protein
LSEKITLPSEDRISKEHHEEQMRSEHHPCENCHAKKPSGGLPLANPVQPSKRRYHAASPPPTKTYVADLQETIGVIEGSKSETKVERYPNLEAPDTIAANQNFAVQVSLTGTPLSLETKIIAGNENEGRVVVDIPPSEDAWQIEVDLTAPGFDFQSGSSNSQFITLPRDGDSTIALFHLHAKPFTGPSQLSKIYATFYHDDAFIARVERPLTVVPSTSEEATPEASSVSNSTAILPVPQVPRRAISLTVDPKDPTLTIEEIHTDNASYVLLHSKYYGSVSAEMPDADKLQKWIKERVNDIAQAGRGLSVGTAQPVAYASDLANAFGNDLYDKFAPQAFKKLFWDLYDDHGTDFSSIQVISDNPILPWELMRPVRPDGTGRQQFLGLHFKIARWHIRSEALPRPPQVVALSTLAVIAPNYEGAQALPAMSDELKSLSSLPEFIAIGGDYQSVRGLATHLPNGIIHFAGHGATRTQDGVPQFLILLQDVELAPSTWQALISVRPETHPLFFFNACEVGEVQEFINEVEGWAPALLDSGASGYIGALWPISDRVAAQFASDFYGGIAAGLHIGTVDVAELLAATRLSVYQKTNDPTALAYVLYGDPELVLVPPQHAPANSSVP